ncbi:MAG TPA: hypothetical protein VEC36_11525 [Patescibacteria group bacterium]|nr:hypothetical protein [Patescibacteria group bacterium]
MTRPLYLRLPRREDAPRNDGAWICAFKSFSFFKTALRTARVTAADAGMMYDRNLFYVTKSF